MRREILFAFLEIFPEDASLREELGKLETDLTEAGDQHGRISHLWQLAKIHITLENKADVERLLNNILRETFRVGYRKDYQFESLIRSCGLFANNIPENVWEVIEQIRGWIPELGLLTEGPAERSAALECLDLITHFYPAESMETFSWFVDNNSITYFGGLEIVINAALRDHKLELSTVIAILIEYFIPLSEKIPSQLMETTILHIYRELKTPNETLLSLIDAIRTYALPSIRPKWIEEIIIFVLRSGHQINNLNIQEEEIEQEVYDDKKLILDDGSKYNILLACEQISNLEDYRAVRARVINHKLFPWDAILSYIIPNLNNEEQADFIKGLKNHYLLLQMMQIYNRKEMTHHVRNAFLSILELESSPDFPPTGWSNPYFFELMAKLASLDPNLVPEKIIPLILKDMGKIHLYLLDKMLVCDSLISILLSQDNIDIRLLWEFLRNYISTLFDGMQLPDIPLNGSSQSVENLIFSHVINNLEHDLRAIREASIKLLILLSKQKRENLMELILTRLSDGTLPQFGILQFLSCYKQEFGELSPVFISRLNSLHKFPNAQYRFLIERILSEVRENE